MRSILILLTVICGWAGSLSAEKVEYVFKHGRDDDKVVLTGTMALSFEPDGVSGVMTVTVVKGGKKDYRFGDYYGGKRKKTGRWKVSGGLVYQGSGSFTLPITLSPLEDPDNVYPFTDLKLVYDNYRKTYQLGGTFNGKQTYRTLEFRKVIGEYPEHKRFLRGQSVPEGESAYRIITTQEGCDLKLHVTSIDAPVQFTGDCSGGEGTAYFLDEEGKRVSRMEANWDNGLPVGEATITYPNSVLVIPYNELGEPDYTKQAVQTFANGAVLRISINSRFEYYREGTLTDANGTEYIISSDDGKKLRHTGKKDPRKPLISMLTSADVKTYVDVSRSTSYPFLMYTEPGKRAICYVQGKYTLFMDYNEKKNKYAGKRPKERSDNGEESNAVYLYPKQLYQRLRVNHMWKDDNYLLYPETEEQTARLKAKLDTYDVVFNAEKTVENSASTYNYVFHNKGSQAIVVIGGAIAAIPPKRGESYRETGHMVRPERIVLAPGEQYAGRLAGFVPYMMNPVFVDSLLYPIGLDQASLLKKTLEQEDPAGADQLLKDEKFLPWEDDLKAIARKGRLARGAEFENSVIDKLTLSIRPAKPLKFAAYNKGEVLISVKNPSSQTLIVHIDTPFGIVRNAIPANSSATTKRRVSVNGPQDLVGKIIFARSF